MAIFCDCDLTHYSSEDMELVNLHLDKTRHNEICLIYQTLLPLPTVDMTQMLLEKFKDTG